MKSCGSCGRENEDAASQCCECGSTDLRTTNQPPPAPEASSAGAELLDATERRLEPARVLSPAEMELDFVTLIKCGSLPEADVVVSELEGAGIEAIIPDEFAAQNFPLPVMVGFVRVQVAPQDYAAARELLATKVPEA